MAVPSNNGLEQEVSPPAAAEDSVPPTAKVVNREATELEPYHSAATDTSTRTMIQYQGHFEPLKKFWRRQVSLTVPHVKCRDHLANERTFLAWIRTSIALSMLGAVIAQLFRLQNGPSPTGAVNLFVIATPLACACQGAALVTAMSGGHRYWRQQNAMARGEALASGWELWLMICISGSVLLVLFVFILTLD